MALIEGPPPYPRHDGWEETAKWHSKNEDFYRNIVHEIGELLGPEVYVADDGSVMEDVLALKVPEVLRKRLRRVREVHEEFKQTEPMHSHMRCVCNGMEATRAIMEGRSMDYDQRPA